MTMIAEDLREMMNELYSELSDAGRNRLDVLTQLLAMDVEDVIKENVELHKQLDRMKWERVTRHIRAVKR